MSGRGILGAMDTMHQRAKFEGASLIRSMAEEKGQQIANVLTPVGETEHGHFVADAEQAAAHPARNPQGGVEGGLGYPQKTALKRKNVFAALVERAKSHSLGQISRALYIRGWGISTEYVALSRDWGMNRVERT